ncbi:MAG: alpha/beta hydrolase [Desulfofustis sp.]|nr:alpha/beta hydrolase [Desulfofustis sp.]NNK58672.1 alpha/beta hydrolase [Desulfofustis sp.]
MTQQEEFLERYRNLRDWYYSIFTEMRIASSGGGTLRVALPKDHAGNPLAVVVSGRTEYLEKYLEFARDLYHRGVSTVLYDHCGQGDSDRQLADRQKGYIDSFETYVTDLGKVIKKTHNDSKDVPANLISHSMGGTVAALLGLRHPEQVKKMVLGSPMCAIVTGSRVPQFLIKPITAVGCHLGFGDRYMPSKGPYRPDMQFHENPFTSDENRFSFNQFLTNSLDFAPLGGPTFRWLHEAYKAMRDINSKAERFLCPHLTLTAAGDQIVKTAAVKRFCERSSNGTHEEYMDVRHELFMEIDRVRDDILSRIVAFLETDR